MAFVLVLLVLQKVLSDIYGLKSRQEVDIYIPVIYIRKDRMEMERKSRRMRESRDEAPICIRAKANLSIGSVAQESKPACATPGSNLVMNPVISARLAASPTLSLQSTQLEHPHSLIRAMH